MYIVLRRAAVSQLEIKRGHMVFFGQVHMYYIRVVINQIENANGEYVKEITYDQRADNSRCWRLMGLQCSERNPHPEIERLCLHHMLNVEITLLLNIFLFLTESGVGAGIDSYYEYVLKAYILLGDDEYLDRFNKVRPPIY